MQYIRRWLKPPTSARIALRPHRTIEIPQGYDAAYARAMEAIQVTLGANVYMDDRAGRTIEAGFGLVHNERIRVTFENDVADVTRVRVEAFFPAGASIPAKSDAVDALVRTIAASL